MTARRKSDLIYALFSATFYTILYIILSLLEPGPGFQNSLIARFAIGKLFALAFLLIVIGCIVLGFLYGVFVFILSIAGIKEDDASCFALGWVVSMPVILYFSIALGFVSIGEL